MPLPGIVRPARRGALCSALLLAAILTGFGVPTLAADSHRTAGGFTLTAAKTANPLWSELSASQRHALSPLAAEWNKLDPAQKKKWLALSDKFAGLQTEQQLRLQDRMREWSKLTPEQRRVARESYSRAKALGPDQKSAEWERYQLLTEEQKKKLAEEAAAKKRVANLPPPAQGKATGKQATPSQSPAAKTPASPSP